MPRSGPALGLGLQVAAVTAVVALAAGTVIGWRTLGAVDAAADGGVEVALASLDAVESSLETADALLTESRAVLDMAVVALRSLVGSVDESTEALTSVAELTATAAPALASARSTLESLTGTAGAIDTALRTLSRLPLGPDYDPDRAFAPAVEQLVDDLAPVPGALRSTSEELEDLAEVSQGFDGELAAVTTALDGIRAMLADSGSVLEEYREAARSARQLAADTAARGGVDLGWARAVLVIGALSLAVGQVVPFRHGASLREG